MWRIMKVVGPECLCDNPDTKVVVHLLAYIREAVAGYSKLLLHGWCQKC